MEELLDIQSEIIGNVWNSYYKIEVLRGYCESLEDEKISSVMLETLLGEICLNQRNIIKIVDNKLTHFAHKNFSVLNKIKD